MLRPSASAPSPARPGQRLAVLLALAGAGVAVAAAPAAAETLPGRYIVTVDERSDPRAVAVEADGERPRFVYRSALNGFAAALTEAEVAALRRDPEVERIEPDQTVRASATQAMDAAGDPWGLDRLDQAALPLSRTYSYGRDGAGVRAYVIDSGVDPAHREFAGRARNVFDSLGGTGADCNGHGTHVAGTIGAGTYGVAKRALVRGVRVLDCQGNGTMSGVIAGLDWVRTNRVRPAVANLSLGGGRSEILNAAVADLVAADVFVAVAAGNEASDACRTSPASAPGAYTTAASDRLDRRAAFSNHGPCVDGYAPGVGVRSTLPGGGTGILSGTSMASPHVAGVGALLKAYGDRSPGAVASWIDGAVTPGVIGANLPGTPNRLLAKQGL